MTPERLKELRSRALEQQHLHDITDLGGELLECVEEIERFIGVVSELEKDAEHQHWNDEHRRVFRMAIKWLKGRDLP